MNRNMCLRMLNKIAPFSNGSCRQTYKNFIRQLSVSGRNNKDDRDVEKPKSGEKGDEQIQLAKDKTSDNIDFKTESDQVAHGQKKTFEYKPLQREPPRMNPNLKVKKVFVDDYDTAKRAVMGVVKTKEEVETKMGPPPQHLPSSTEVLIIGGGAMGASVAYWLKQKIPGDILKVLVVERDHSYATASTCLSVGGIRQQFSLTENILMSSFGAEFLRNIDRYCGVEGEPSPCVHFEPYGYLVLASEKGAQTLIDNASLQKGLGVKNVLLSPERLKEKFPWMNVDGIALGCLGLENEGWFDPWSLLNAYKRRSVYDGVQYLKAEVIGFTIPEFTEAYVESPTGVIVRLPDGKTHHIRYNCCVIAAGPDSGHVARLASIGTGSGVLSCPLPVERRKRYVYSFHSPDGPGINTPLMIDKSGTYFRREGLAGFYIAGVSPSPEEEPSTDDLDVDYNYFDSNVWPVLAERVPAFENLKLRNAWAGYYEYNIWDQNGIVGRHPHFHNIYFATGFSGHGIQHSPAVGRAIMELIVDKKYETIDLTRLQFDRFISDRYLLESNIF